MALIVKDRVRETSTTTGTGTITLAGASTGFRSFADIGNANTTYYCISGGSQFEVGVGTYTASGTTLSRDTVLSNSLGTTAKIDFSAGSKDVFVTYPSDKALLGTTSAVSSTGTGDVVLNSNPSFATDITVNGLTVGKGDGNISTNTAFGNDAIGSPYIISANTNNVGIGYNALSQIGAGVGSLSILTGGSYTADDDIYEATLVYVSGTPIISGGTFPIVEITISGGVVTNINSIINKGVGFSDTTTAFTLGLEFNGSGFTCQIASLSTAINNTALGYNAGYTQKSGSNNVFVGNNSTATGSNSVYIGSNTFGSGSNQIAIGSNIFAGSASNSVIIGDTSITSTTLRGSVGITGSLTAVGSLQLTGGTTIAQSIATSQTTGNLTIGGASATGAITLGRSTGAQTVNIATGVTAASTTKAVNIGTAGNATSTTNIAIGSTTGTSTTTLNGAVTLSADTQAINIGTSQTSGAITIGGAGGASGTIKLGQSTGTQTIEIANGVSGTKTINIASGTSGNRTLNIATSGNVNSIANINLGVNTGTNNINLGTGTGDQNINIGTGATAAFKSKYIYIGTNGLADSETNIQIGGDPALTSIILNGVIFFPVQFGQATSTVASLPAGFVGDRFFVNDALAPTFGATVVGGGTVRIPVYHDGTSWKVG
jgi:hypothetical protein